jgi:hypothetical protein
MIRDRMACDAGVTFEGHEAFIAGFVSAKLALKDERLKLCDRCRDFHVVCQGAAKAAIKKMGGTVDGGPS